MRQSTARGQGTLPRGSRHSRGERRAFITTAGGHRLLVTRPRGLVRLAGSIRGISLVESDRLCYGLVWPCRRSCGRRKPEANLKQHGYDTSLPPLPNRWRSLETPLWPTRPENRCAWGVAAPYDFGWTPRATKSNRHRPSASMLCACTHSCSLDLADRSLTTKGLNLYGPWTRAWTPDLQMSYTIDCLKTGFPAALELLLDCVLNPAFEEGEVEDQKARLAALLGGKDIHATLMTEVCGCVAARGRLKLDGGLQSQEESRVCVCVYEGRYAGAVGQRRGAHVQRGEYCRGVRVKGGTAR